MKRTLTLALLATIAGATIAGPTAPATTAPVCTEDMACWDWQTMGNHCRGTDRPGLLECVGIEPDTGAYVGGYN